MASGGSVGWMPVIGGMLLVVGIFSEWWVLGIGVAMIVLGIFSATRS